MNISNLAQKQPWIRKTARYYQDRIGTANITEQMNLPCDTGIILTQDDFANEMAPSAHRIYDVHFRSNRPLYKYNEATGKNEPNGCEPVARVSVALQQAIVRHKTTHSFGNPMWFGNESGMSKTIFVDTFKSYWASSGMDLGIMEWGESCFTTGDGGIAIFKNEVSELRYKVFSYSKGDVVCEFINPSDNNKRNILRKYKEHGIEVVEIYMSTRVQKWVKAQEDDSTFKKWFGAITGRRSEDGYILLSDKYHGFTQCPVAYHREPDIASGPVQSQIEDIESLLSDLMENGKFYNFQILFLTGQIVSLPSIGQGGKVIVSRNKEGDAKLLAPADASNTFELSLDNSFRMLCDCVGAVFIRPEDLKAGSDSGAFLTNLYFPEHQWALQAYARMNDAIKTIISIFKEAVGIMEGNVSEYTKLRLSHVITPLVPKNTTEEINNINQSLAAGSISRLTACGETPIGASDEYERVEKERAEATAEELARQEQELAAQVTQNINPIDGRVR
jgi:hypothetical protein